MLIAFSLLFAILMLTGAVATHLIAARLARALTSLRISGEVLRALPRGQKPNPELAGALREYAGRALSR